MRWWYPEGLPEEVRQEHLASFSVVFVFWLAGFFIQGLFEIQALRNLGQLLARLAGALFFNLLLASVYFYFQPALVLTPRRFLLAVLALSGLFVFVWYLIVRFGTQRLRIERLYTLGSGQLPEALVEVIRDHYFTGLRFGGVYTVGSDMPKLLPANSNIILPHTGAVPGEHMEHLLTLQRQGVHFVPAHVLYERLVRRVYSPALSELWFLENVSYRRRRGYDIVKRGIDILAGLIGLVVLAAVLAVIALVIKTTSQGPIFFSQGRVGQNNRPFTIRKFRTMRMGVNDTWTVPGDARITFVGNILRRLRVDELPQAWNLLVGEMSIVGPRPEQVHIVEELKKQIPFYSERHVVKPGLTGWAQLHVYASTVEETKRKLEYDLYYIKHRSLLFDVEIILKTIYHVLVGSGR